MGAWKTDGLGDIKQLFNGQKVKKNGQFGWLEIEEKIFLEEKFRVYYSTLWHGYCLKNQGQSGPLN